MEIALDKSNHSASRPKARILTISGAILIVLGELLILLDIKIITPYVFLLYWYGYVFLLDGINHVIRKHSLIIDRTKYFLITLLLSIIIWWVFEIYNYHIFHAWRYILPPTSEWVKFILSRIAWATVLPAILETADLAEFLYTRLVGERTYAQSPEKENLNASEKLSLIGIMIVGFLLLVLPWTGIYPYVLRLPRDIVLILSFLFWGAFALFLDPILYLSGKPSLIRQIKQGDFSKIIILLSTGYICGFLWEFWNAWAGAKWTYTATFLSDKMKIFEMPISGFLDFGPFAVSMYVICCFFSAMINPNEQRDEI